MNLQDAIAEKEIERVTKYALSHRLTIDQVKECSAGTRGKPDENPCHVMLLPQKVTAVYSIEEHPGGWYNHVKISMDGKIPPQPLSMALAVFISRPQGPKLIESKEDVAYYIDPEKNSAHIMIPFVEPSLIIRVGAH